VGVLRLNTDLGPVSALKILILQHLKNQDFKSIKTEHDKLYSQIKFSYPINFEEDFDKTIRRLKRAPSYAVMIEQYRKKEHSSEQWEIEKMKNFLRDDLCHGEISCLLDKMSNTELAHLQKTLTSLKVEDIFYRQLLQVPIYRAQLNEDSSEKLAELKKEDPNCVLPQGASFLAKSSFKEYKQQLYSLLVSVESPTHAIFGIAALSLHEICFRFGEDGYFIYDPHTRALYQYPDQETFFKGLRSRVLQLPDIEDIDKANVIFKIKIKIGFSFL
jgi:hypothetical protein